MFILKVYTVFDELPGRLQFFVKKFPKPLEIFKIICYNVYVKLYKGGDAVDV